ncbi:MAG: DUF559 domain-containing protein [Chitinophagaceae bacterium]|nr:DUF559 domain-containing protein [Chitinophagaceae bacterium]MBK9381949.1 DUF559 domain-containing protein [Chitinophagaceae bacterium]MBL0304708.1 DUF559 domain-containing protein [Chitinophagaceae bacterium]
MDTYVLYFYCHESKLAIELDGAIHNNEMNRQYDNVSTPFLRQHYNIKSGYLY